MKKVSREQVGHFMVGMVFGGVLVGLLAIWSFAPTFVRAILIVCLVTALAMPWLPEIDLRKGKIQQKGGE